MRLIVDNHMYRVLSEFRFRFAVHRSQAGRTASRNSGCQNGRTAFYYAKAFDSRWRGFRHQPDRQQDISEGGNGVPDGALGHEWRTEDPVETNF